MHKLRVGILGATGSVGQRFIQLLDKHPWFKITALVASEQSAGKPYKDAVSWRMDTAIPKDISNLVVVKPVPSVLCDFVFSALDSSVAGSIEEHFAQEGYPVISNSKNHRMDQDVPLLIPEVNSKHLKLLSIQKKNRGYTNGFIVTNPNCSTIGLTMALKPLNDDFGIEKVQVTTLQALSGAGFPGIASIDIIDNVIPYVGDEEEKVETEPKKILGTYKKETIDFSKMLISAQCNRVAVIDGHMETVSVKLKKKTSIEQVLKSLQTFSTLPQKLNLPLAPKHPLIVMTQSNRPQPRLDRNLEKGMAVVVGRIRPCPIFDYKFVVLSHNTIRGAAGAAILNAELLYKEKFLKTKSK